MFDAGERKRVRLLAPACVALPVLAVGVGQAVTAIRQMASAGTPVPCDPKVLCLGVVFSFLFSLVACGLSLFLAHRLRVRIPLAPSCAGLRLGVKRALPAILLVMAVSAAQETLFAKWGFDFGKQPVLEWLVGDAFPLWTRVFLAVYAVVITPFVEELTFRGVVFSSLRATGLPFFPAALIGGLYFASLHLFVPALVPLTLFGILLAAAYERSGSLLSSVAMHMLFNGASLIIALFFGL